MASQQPISSKIAFVEDDDVLRDELAFQLRRKGFSVDCFESAPQLYRAMAIERFALAILDIGLEGEDGLSICRHLRAGNSEIGIIFMTARGLRTDRLEGLAAGADGFLVKPVDIEELALLARRLVERGSLTGGSIGEVPAQPPSAGGRWTLNPEMLALNAPGGHRIALTPAETRFLVVLANRKNETCTFTEVLAPFGMADGSSGRHRLELILSRLRSKVHKAGVSRLPVYSVRGIGYRFLPDED